MKRILMLGVAVAPLVAACSGSGENERPPRNASNPACDDLYQPIACIDGNEVCQIDKNGCDVCTCEPERPVAPGGDSNLNR